MKFVKRELKVNVYGNELSLTFPTVKQSQEYAKSIDESSDKEATEKLLSFLEVLGLPKDIAEDMESDHLTQVISALVPSQKK